MKNVFNKYKYGSTLFFYNIITDIMSTRFSNKLHQPYRKKSDCAIVNDFYYSGDRFLSVLHDGLQKIK